MRRHVLCGFEQEGLTRGAVRGFLVQTEHSAVAIRPERNPAPVRRPDRIDVVVGIEREPRRHAACDLDEPDVLRPALRVRPLHRDPRAVGREHWVAVGARRAEGSRWSAGAIDPCQVRRRRCSARDVHQRTATGEAEFSRAVRFGQHLLDEEDRIARHLEADGIETHRAQRAGARVHQMTGLDVCGLAGAANQGLALAVPEIEHRGLHILKIALWHDREQHSAPARQERWPIVIELAVRSIGRRQHRRLPAAGRHAEQACGPRVRGEHDRVVRTQLAPSMMPWIRATVTAGPPVIDTFCSSSPGNRTKPIERLSGEMNGKFVPVRPRTGAWLRADRPRGSATAWQWGWYPSCTRRGGHLERWPRQEIQPTVSRAADRLAGRWLKRTGSGAGGAAGRIVSQTAVVTRTLASAVAMKGIMRCQRGRGGATTDAGATADATLADSVITYCAIEISAIRCRRSFTRHRWTSVRIAGDTSEGNAFQSGSPRGTAASVSLTSSPSSARVAVSIS